MKETVNEYRFIDGFRECNREDNFSREGREAMYEYFTDMEHGEFEIEYDPIDICCVYTEYDNITEFNDAYGKDYEDFDFFFRRCRATPPRFTGAIRKK